VPIPSLRAASTLTRLVGLSVAAGLLISAITLPVVGALGVATRDAARTFNTLRVPILGRVPTRSELLNANGSPIAYYYPNNIYRIPVSYEQIAPVMRDAIVAIEDSRFYLHGAIDFRGTIRALVNDLSHNPVQGGSTLAQQYVKNVCVLTARTAKAASVCTADTTARKIRELRMAVTVTHETNKHELLADYLNVAYFENHAYGIQVAAQRYFSTTASQLTLTQSALLAGLVENPARYNPLANPGNALTRRNTVLARMAQVGYITQAQATEAEKAPLGLHPSMIPLQTGCYSRSARYAAFFCDYVLAVMRTTPMYAKAWKALNTTGGLKIYTTLSPRDQRAADDAVNYIVPPDSDTFNPGHNADTEVLIQPGTGAVRAIAVDRPYGTGAGHTTVDYAVDTKYDGSTDGVQTGSSNKIYTLITALDDGIPFGFSESVSAQATIGGYTDCQGGPAGSDDGLPPGVYHLTNAEPSDQGSYTLYTGTTDSINVFYAKLELKVGLCNVVKTAARMGDTFVNGGSLLRSDRALGQPPADEVPSFTLGSDPVSPMTMAAAYASVAAQGVYCRPEAITKIVTASGGSLPVQSADCHRDMSTAVADAANYILQGVLTTGTAAGQGIGRPAAGKTGTSNGGFYAAFAGYTPTLAGYVSVFNPVSAQQNPMIGGSSCYRTVGGSLDCPGQMFGANAPAATWQMTFLHAALGPARPFAGLPPNSPFFSMGTGITAPKPPPGRRPPAPGHPRHGL
jgi:membrane peptidoglycan carboxypeptidase